MYDRDRRSQATRDLMARPDRPDAIFVGNDHMAFAVMDTLRFELGLSVPGDVSVVGYDDVPLAAWGAYDLTTVRQPLNRMVDATVDTLLAQIDDATRPAAKDRNRRAADPARIGPHTGRMADMKGFSNRWTDFPDYILGITKEIWEDRGIATLHHYYAPDLVVRIPCPAWSWATRRDRRHHGDAGRVSRPHAAGRGCDLVGHARDGDAVVAPVYCDRDPSGRRASMARPRARCWATGSSPIATRCNDQINDEWLIRDQGAIVRQLGWDPRRLCPRPDRARRRA